MLGEAEKANAQSRKLQDLFEDGSDSSVIRSRCGSTRSPSCTPHQYSVSVFANMPRPR